MDDKDIHVGDKVRVRSWEDMASEFGERKINSISYIDTQAPFIQTMKRFCGMFAVISDIEIWAGFGDKKEGSISKVKNSAAGYLPQIC